MGKGKFEVGSCEEICFCVTESTLKAQLTENALKTERASRCCANENDANFHPAIFFFEMNTRYILMKIC